MLFKNVSEDLKTVIDYNYTSELSYWLEDKINDIISNKSTKDLYLTYSLIASKIDVNKKLLMPHEGSEIFQYLLNHQTNYLELGRIYILVKVLEADKDFFTSKVSNIIQVADTTELETFLKYLILLPNPEAHKHVAVDALRTNITPVFDAISLNNPYPALYFDDNQWNQMYLKAAFMQRDLSAIVDIDKRANKELARIISDFAHERWAASRDINPYFWKPVGKFIDDVLLEDMKKLFESSNENEKIAAALCCSLSNNNKANELLNENALLKQKIEQNLINWDTIK
ncbi:EboA domain-containing protein [Confluentibacter citreus]|uniref:EboA domain-containing protein n=1 Tax=Confluentibacter citreus TaxID=2007307 RepID=UPI000C284C97|nr:EboA domain-containing protein [Confluentibacter citreus]